MNNSDETATAVLRRLDQVLDRLDAIAPSTIPRLLTIQETAERLGVSKDTVRRLCDRRELRFIQAEPNAAKRIAVSDLQAWIDRHAVATLRR